MNDTRTKLNETIVVVLTMLSLDPVSSISQCILRDTHTYKETYQLVPSRTPPSSGARVPYPKSERLEESISETISSGGKKWQNGYCIYFSHPPQLSGPMMAQNVGAFRGKICFIFPFNFL